MKYLRNVCTEKNIYDVTNDDALHNYNKFTNRIYLLFSIGEFVCCVYWSFGNWRICIVNTY